MIGREIYFCDALHFRSMRGMWRYRNQLLGHMSQSIATVKSLPDRMKSCKSQFLQVLTHELIEPLGAAALRPDLIVYPFNIVPRFQVGRVPIATVIHDLIFMNHAYTSLGAKYRRMQINNTMISSAFLITVTECVKREIRDSFPDAPCPFVIPNHLNQSFIPQRNRTSRAWDSPRIVHLGGASLSKGTILLLHAFRLLLKEIPNAILVIGAMSGKRNWLEAQLNQTGISKTRVEILSRLSDDELAEAYANADVHCMPSTAEGFGLPIIETASQGTPNVLFRLPVFQEILGDAATYFDERTPSALASALLETLLTNHSERNEAARQRALNFTFENIHSQYAKPAFDEIFKSIDDRLDRLISSRFD